MFDAVFSVAGIVEWRPINRPILNAGLTKIGRILSGVNRMKRTLLVLLVLLAPETARAYVEDTPSLGKLIRDSANIYVVEVEKVSKEKRAIIYRKVADLKGKFTGEIKHNIGDGLHPREPKQILDWAEPGKLAMIFQAGKTAQVCIGPYWYECAEQEPPWWRMTRGAPERSLAYLGSVTRLRGHVAAMLAGKEVVITAVTHGTPAFRGYEPVIYKEQFRSTAYPVWRLRASLMMPGNVYHTATDPRWIVGLGAGDAADVPGLLKTLDDKEPRHRADAADELGLIGRAAKDAVPALTRLANKDADPLVRIRAAEALLRIEPQAKFVQVLIEAMGDSQPKVRRAAVESLGNSGEHAVAAVPKLIDALKDADADVRWAAVLALGRIGPQARAAVTGLIAALQDPALRAVAADALGSIGPAAQPAVPELARLIGPAATARWPIAIALTRIGGDGSEAATPVFIDGLKASDEPTKWDSLFYIQRMGPRGGAAVSALRKLLKNEEENVDIREIAVFTVGKIGPDARDAIPDLLPLLGGDDETLRQRAAVSLAEIGAAAMPGVIGQLKGNPAARYWAAYALERMGPAAASAGAALIDRLRSDGDTDVRGAAAAALGEIGPDARGGADALTAALQDKESRVRILAAEALWKLEKTPDRALPILSKELASKDAPARREAAEALGRLAAIAKAALPLLRKALEDRAADVRVAAAQAVWLIAGDAGVVSVLVAALEDRDSEIRRTAAETLARIGSAARPALNGLSRLLKDREWQVRKAAAEAMRKIDAEAAARAGVP